MKIEAKKLLTRSFLSIPDLEVLLSLRREMIVRRANTVDRLILLEVEEAEEATVLDLEALEDHTRETTLQETEEDLDLVVGISGLDLDLHRDGHTMTTVMIILTLSLRFTFQTWTAELESKISEKLSKNSDLSSL